jgi:hypothetical protein
MEQDPHQDLGYTLLSAGNAYEQAGGAFVQETMRATVAAFQRYLPGEWLPDLPAALLLEDQGFKRLFAETGGMPEELPLAVYVPGLNTIVIPQLLIDLSEGGDPRERAAAQLTIAEQFVYAFTTRPEVNESGTAGVRTGFTLIAGSVTQLLPPGEVYKAEAQQLVPDIELEQTLSIGESKERQLTEATVQFATNLLIY